MSQSPKPPSLRHLPQRWHRAPRRWGHKLHSLCSYMAMFPPTIPHVFVRWLTEPGDVVYDPFSGRGTTSLEACLLGRVGHGSDANPLAWVITAAKVDPPKSYSLRRRLDELERTTEQVDVSDEPDHIRMLFHPDTLGELLWLRQRLDLNSRVDRFLMAALLGVLHGRATKDGHPTGLTVSMPNTFSMSPGYVARYIDDKRLRPPALGVIPFLRHRVGELSLPSGEFCRGTAWVQDAATKVRARLRHQPAKLILTSPPYLRVIQYGQYNWIRLWMLGYEPKSIDSVLFTTESRMRYLDFVSPVLKQLREALRDDGYMCLVVGDVRRGSEEINLASALMEIAESKTDLRPLGTITDRLPIQHKVSRIWGPTKGRATRTDRILILGGPDALPPGPLEPIRWGQVGRGGQNGD
jgi:hypothetical protein